MDDRSESEARRGLAVSIANTPGVMNGSLMKRVQASLSSQHQGKIFLRKSPALARSWILNEREYVREIVWKKKTNINLLKIWTKTARTFPDQLFSPVEANGGLMTPPPSMRGYWPLIGWEWSHDPGPGLWLAEVRGVTGPALHDAGILLKISYATSGYFLHFISQIKHICSFYTGHHWCSFDSSIIQSLGCALHM